MKQGLSGHDSMAYDVTYKRAISIIKEKGSITQSELRRLLLDVYGLPLFAVNQAVDKLPKNRQHIDVEPICKLVDYEYTYYGDYLDE